MDQRTTIFLVATFFANFDDELTSVLVTSTVLLSCFGYTYQIIGSGT